MKGGFSDECCRDIAEEELRGPCCRHHGRVWRPGEELCQGVTWPRNREGEQAEISGSFVEERHPELDWELEKNVR